MSAFGMKPTFKTKEEYKVWQKSWKSLYAEVSERVRKLKKMSKDAQRDGAIAGQLQNNLRQERAMAAKAMTILSEGKIRWQNIQNMRKGIAEQHATFPLVVEDIRNMDFHFNKKHLEFPEIVPMWIIKAKGKTYYVHHVDCNTPWTTREQPDNPSTKGAIRIKRGTLSIDAQGIATID